ncbi:MAG: hypothetical protein DCF25_13185 [Leptolyngbya foveolarum]|uniref:Uncharacterized protein n=1 Tax=Leptolyngbya foveolarum TaxID=47253 RepID=A0A2W4W999_9CYAN|nr:MAG: hypothetical protein DCF25_13185 [Leptolyngbya foveolarum]
MTLDATRWRVRLRSLLNTKPLKAANKNGLSGYLVTSTAVYEARQLVGQYKSATGYATGRFGDRICYLYQR